MAMQSSAIAKQSWELNNNITETLDPNSLNDVLSDEKPWQNDPVYFKRVKISDLALLRMVMHASSNTQVEVVGLLHGKIHGDAFLVTDALPFPVDPNFDAQTKLLEHFKALAQDGGLENVVGWYRSHPRHYYVASPTDISTQMQIQQLKESCLAVLIDPDRTLSIERMPIAAIRTYPEGYTPPDKPSSVRHSDSDEYFLKQTRHLKKRYILDTTKFKSLCDTNLLEDLWNEYWPRTISPPTPDCKSVDKEVPYCGLSLSSEIKRPYSNSSRCSVCDSYYDFIEKNRHGVLEYLVCLYWSLTLEYRSSTEAAEAFCERLMEEAGCSPSQITSNCGSHFYAKLNEEQAKKLAKNEYVKQVRPIMLLAHP